MLRKTENLKRDLKDMIMNTKFNRQGLINKFYEYFIVDKNFYFITEYFQVFYQINYKKKIFSKFFKLFLFEFQEWDTLRSFG